MTQVRWSLFGLIAFSVSLLSSGCTGEGLSPKRTDSAELVQIGSTETVALTVEGMT
jgi:hypothetical protein